MTTVFDGFFIWLGVNSRELKDIKGRTVLYLVLFTMALAACTLSGSLLARAIL